MVVTRVENLTDKRFQVWLDGEAAFVLYKGDLRHYKIFEGAELSKTVYELILHEVLYKRAEKRALHLLEQRDYTVEGLRKKLTEGKYSEEIAEAVICRMKEYHYLDDERYAKQYIACCAKKRSRKEITRKLWEKGIPRDVIENAYESFLMDGNEIDEAGMARKLLLKHGYHGECAERKELDRHAAYLMRKGFSGSDVYKAISDLQEEFEGSQDS